MSYVLVLTAISLLILVHEAGHFIAAKSVGIPIGRFSIGFGRRVWGFTRNNTEYRLCLIPCGGYVLPDIASDGEFFLLPLTKRVLFALGGPLANILGALLCLSLINMAQSGLSLDAAFLNPVREACRLVLQTCAVVPQLFGRPNEISGLVGIVAFGGKQVGTSIYRLLQLCVVLNVNLAVLNLLPIPPLDGGRIVMAILERGCTPFRRLEVPLAIGGWVALIALMLYATALDILRITQGLA